MNDDKVFDLNNEGDVNSLQEKVSSANGEPVIVSFKEVGKEDIAIGVAVPKNHPASISYLSEISDFNDPSQDIYKQIELCRKLYTWEGIIGTVLDMYVDLSYGTMKVDGIKGNKKAQKLVEHLFRNVNKSGNNVVTGLEYLLRSIALEFYICGNVFIYSKWSNVVIEELKGKYKLPMNITTLDPMIIDIPRESVQFGNKVIQILRDRVFSDKFATREQKEKMMKHMPTKIRNRFGKDYAIELDPYYTYHIKRKGSMYGGWGIPYLTRSFSAIASKYRLRTLDNATIDGLINSITIFKIGDKELPETWSQSRLMAFSRLIRNPAASMLFVWTWDIDVLHIGPSGDILNFSDRYKDADSDILYSLGAPAALMTGQGERAGDVWASILFLMERLEEERHHAKAFVEDMILKVFEQNNITGLIPTIRLIKPKVNKDEIRNIVLGYYDRGLISKETADEEAGYDIVSETEKRTEEAKEMDKVMVQPSLPYTTNNPNPQTTSPKDVQKKDNTKKDTKTLETDQKPRKTTPRMEGNVRDRLRFIFESAFFTTDENTDKKQLLYNLGKDLYNFDDSKTTNLLGVSKDTYNDIVKEITSGSNKEEDIFDKLDKYFLQ